MECKYDLKELLEKKHQIEGETQKYITAKKMLDIPELFFRIDRNTALGLLMYLEVPSKDLESTYISLLSYSNYKETEKQVYQLFDIQDQITKQ